MAVLKTLQLITDHVYQDFHGSGKLHSHDTLLGMFHASDKDIY